MAREYNIEEMSPQEMITEAQRLLEAAGMDAKTAEEMLFIGGVSAAQSILTHPNPEAMANYMAENNPNAAKSQYGELDQGFTEFTPRTSEYLAANPELLKVPAKNYQINEEGVIKYANGVIYDPATGQPVFPPNDPTAVGSPAWFLKVQDEWNARKIESERKRLINFGWDISAKGGWDKPFRDALYEFHSLRYSNGGKPLPLGTAKQTTAQKFGGALDPAVLRGEVRAWFEEAYDDEPSDTELDFWTQKLAGTAKRIVANKGLEPAAAVGVAHARTQERFRQTPEAREFARQAEEEEENTELRDSLLSIGQIVGGV